MLAIIPLHLLDKNQWWGFILYIPTSLAFYKIGGLWIHRRWTPWRTKTTCQGVQTDYEIQVGRKLWHWAVYPKVASAGSHGRWPKANGCLQALDGSPSNRFNPHIMNAQSIRISADRAGYGGSSWCFGFRKGKRVWQVLIAGQMGNSN